MSIDIKRYKETGEKIGKGGGGHKGKCNYSADLIKNIVDEIAKGRGVREMSREHNIPFQTISGWVNGHYRTDVTGGSLYDLADL